MLDFVLKYWIEFLFGLIVAALSAAYGRLEKKFKAEKKKNAAIESGLRAILRMRILDTYDMCVADGKISVSRKDAIASIYQSYCALGDADTVDDTIRNLYEEIVRMPIE